MGGDGVGGVVVAAPRRVHLSTLAHHALAGTVGALRPIRRLRHWILTSRPSALTRNPGRVARTVVVPVVRTLVEGVVEVGIGGASSQVRRLGAEGGLWTWVGLPRRQGGRRRGVSCVARVRARLRK